MSKTHTAAVVPSVGSPVEIRQIPIPQPGAHEILVKNIAVATNPVDWKIQSYGFAVQNYPSVLGSDVAGIIEAVGPEVDGDLHIGDHVTGFACVIGTDRIVEGAFQQYTILRDIATAKLPSGYTDMRKASTFPMTLATTAYALHAKDAFNLPLDFKAGPSDAFLIYGASSAVGSTAIQVARNMGFTVIAVASAQHEAYLTSLGAAHVLDRKAGLEQMGQSLSALLTSHKLHLTYAFDTIAGGDTFDITTTLLSKSSDPGKKLAVALPWPQDKAKPSDITVHDVVAFYCFSTHVDIGKYYFNTYLPQALETGTIVASPPVRVIEGGLASTQQAWDLNKKGVSAQKLVIDI